MKRKNAGDDASCAEAEFLVKKHKFNLLNTTKIVKHENSLYHSNNTELFSHEILQQSKYESQNSNPSANLNKLSELHCAALSGDNLRCSQILIINPKAVNELTNLGLVALDLAAIKGHLQAFKAIREFMTYKQIYNVRPAGDTIVELIVKEEVFKAGHYTIFALLVDGLSTCDIKKYTKKILYAAASQGHYDICELIIKEVPKLVKQTRIENEYEYNAVLIASIKGHNDIVRLFVRSISIDDIHNSIEIEQRNESLSLSTAVKDYTPTFLKELNHIVSEYIHAYTRSGYPLIDKCNAAYHAQVIELYQMLTERYSQKIDDIEMKCFHKKNIKDVNSNFGESFLIIQPSRSELKSDQVFSKPASFLSLIDNSIDMSELANIEKDITINISGETNQ